MILGGGKLKFRWGKSPLSQGSVWNPEIQRHNYPDTRNLQTWLRGESIGALDSHTYTWGLYLTSGILDSYTIYPVTRRNLVQNAIHTLRTNINSTSSTCEPCLPMSTKLSTVQRTLNSDSVLEIRWGYKWSWWVAMEPLAFDLVARQRGLIWIMRGTESVRTWEH